jgi:hypothetical protein
MGDRLRLIPFGVAAVMAAGCGTGSTAAGHPGSGTLDGGNSPLRVCRQNASGYLRASALDTKAIPHDRHASGCGK